MKYFDSFAGIGGFSVGIKKVIPDAECVGFSEVDKYAIQVYEKNFPSHKNYGDITQINAKELPDFDLLVGGFPCQAFSIAGKRKGFDDTRGTLFFDLARILRAKQPRLFVFENVKGLLSHSGGNTFRTIIATIDELGYDLQWQVLNSKNHGVPQNRERVFIIGHLRGTRRPEVFPIRGSNKKILEQIVGGRQGNRVYSSEGVSCTLVGGKGAKTGLYIIPHTKKGNVYCLDANHHKGQNNPKKCNRSNVMVNERIRRLTPVECARLQGFPGNWNEEGILNGEVVKISDTQRYKQFGNAVTVNVIEAIFKNL